MKSTTPNGFAPTLLSTLAISPYVWLILVLYAAVRTGRTLGEAASFWIYRFPLLLPLTFVGVCFWNRRKDFTLAGIALSFLLAITGAPIAWGTVVLYIVARGEKTLAEAATYWAHQFPVTFVVVFASIFYHTGRKHRDRPIEDVSSTA